MKTAILSTDDNQDYLGYLPYVQVAWNLLGWNTLTFYIGDKDLESSEKNKIINLDPIKGFRNATVLQVSRLFGAKYTDGFIMTSDVDMMPLSDYWKPDLNSWTVYGEDLTDYKHYPICYIAAPNILWNQIIYEQSIQELLEKYKQSKSHNFDEWWYVDQDIITERLRPQKPTSINRGSIYHGIAKGRIDRIAWSQTLNIEEVKIDAHMPRPFNQKAASDLILKYLITDK
jgi:hypothetical protein